MRCVRVTCMIVRCMRVGWEYEIVTCMSVSEIYRDGDDRGGQDAEQKIRTPHKDVGNKIDVC